MRLEQTWHKRRTGAHLLVYSFTKSEPYGDKTIVFETADKEVHSTAKTILHALAGRDLRRRSTPISH